MILLGENSLSLMGKTLDSRGSVNHLYITLLYMCMAKECKGLVHKIGSVHVSTH